MENKIKETVPYDGMRLNQAFIKKIDNKWCIVFTNNKKDFHHSLWTFSKYQSAKREYHGVLKWFKENDYVYFENYRDLTYIPPYEGSLVTKTKTYGKEFLFCKRE